MSGFALAYRAAWTHPVFRNLLEAAIWQYLCQNAAFADCKIRFCDRLVHLKRGQIIVSRSYLAKGFEIGEQVIRTLFSNLQAEGMITSQSTSHGTLITICNYDKYQLENGEANQPTNQPLTSQLTSGQPAGNQNNNELNKNNIYITPLVFPPSSADSENPSGNTNGHAFDPVPRISDEHQAELDGQGALFELPPLPAPPPPPQIAPTGPLSGSRSGSKGRWATTLQPDWEPGEKVWQWAVGYYPQVINVRLELEKFKNRNFAHGTAYKNWDAAFKTWITNAVEFKAKDQGKEPTGDGHSFRAISRLHTGQKVVV